MISAPDAARARALDPLVRAWLAARGASDALPLSAPEPVWPSEAEVPRSSLEVLTHVESSLREVRELSARFNERAALKRYAEAARQLSAALEIPHVHAWLAEVQLELGLCAAQLGELGLAETALTHAASLDPQRTLQAAEAPPSVLALARSIERRRANAPLSQVRIEVEPEGASLWLDEKPLGQAPLEVSATSGLHVLRVAAPGHHTYASLIELGPGRRGTLRVRLSETSEEAARRALVADLHAPNQARARAEHLARQRDPAPLWFFEGGGGPLLRARAYRCEPGCTLLGTLGEGPALPAVEQTDPTATRSWLYARPTPASPPKHEERRWWRRWPVWTAGAIAVVGAGVAAAVVATREPRVIRERSLVLDPGALPP